jgi:hypothetical protein
MCILDFGEWLRDKFGKLIKDCLDRVRQLRFIIQAWARTNEKWTYP